MKRPLEKRRDQVSHRRRFAPYVGVVAIALVVVSAGLSNATGTETVSAETWRTSEGYMKGQTRYTISVAHQWVCAYVALYLKNSTTGGEFKPSGFANENCNANHPATVAQATTHAPKGAVCDAPGTNYWQARGFGYAQNSKFGPVVHREPDTNYKWGNVVTVYC
jgi:hypothetical protein